MVVKKKSQKTAENTISRESSSDSGAKRWLWGVLILALKVVGVAFLVQGFVLQLATGVLYYGMLHYAIGIIASLAAWHLHKNKCEMCCK